MGLLDELKKKARERVSQTYDQVNMFDGGRTWQQRTPTNTQSVVQQAANHGLTNFARQNVVDPAIKAAQRGYNTGAAATVGTLGLVNAGFESLLGTDQSYQDALNGTQAAMDRRLTAGRGNAGSLMTPDQARGQAPGGVRGNLVAPILGGVGEVAPYVIPVNKIGQGSKLLARTAKQAIAGGTISAGTDLAAQYAQGGPIDARQTAEQAALGAAMAGGLELGGGFMSAGAQIAAKSGQKVIRSVEPKYNGLRKNEIITDPNKLRALNEVAEMTKAEFSHDPKLQHFPSPKEAMYRDKVLREIRDEFGHDWITGVPMKRVRGIPEFMQKNQAAAQALADSKKKGIAGFKKMNEGGYAKNPFDKTPHNPDTALNKAIKAAKGMMDDPDEALKAEARKYKSADEFVKANGRLYHGGAEKWDTLKSGRGMDGEGIYLTSKPERATMYGSKDAAGSVRDAKVQRVALNDARILDGNKTYTRADFPNATGEAATTLDKIFNYYTDGLDGESLALQLRGSSSSNDIARQLGFDAIQKGDDTIVINPAKVMSEKQLTDLYNQATKTRASIFKNEGGYAKNPFGKDVAKGLSKEQADLINDYADMLEGMDNGVQGGLLIPDGDGGKTRITNHTPFYSKVHQETGKPPTKEQWFNEARQQIESGQAMHGASDDFKALTSTATDTPGQPPQPQPVSQPLPDLARSSSDNIPVTVKPPAPTPEMPSQKLSRFANKTVQKSDEVSKPLKKLVKEQKASYEPHTNAARLEEASKQLDGMDGEAAYSHVISRFDKPKNVTDQDIVTAIAAAKKLDEATDDDSLFKATEIYDTLSRHLSKKGQEVQAASLLSHRTPQGLYYAAIKTLDNKDIDLSPADQRKLKQLIDDVKKEVPGGPADGLARHKVAEFVAKKLPYSKAAKGANIWKAGLLTAPTTTAGNTLANTAEQIYKRGYQDPVATGIDMVMSVFTGKRSKVLTGRGVGSGAWEGMVKGVKYMKTGYDPRNPATKFDSKSIHYSDKPLGKAAEAYTQAVFRTMGAQDQPFYYMSLRNSLADQAITAAKNAKLKGSARQEFVKKFITEPSKAAMELADQEARYDVFQNKTYLGNLASGIKDNGGTVADIIVPFSQVPASVATRMIDRTPIGVAKEVVRQLKDKKFNQRAMAKAMADASGGVVLLGVGAALAREGLVTLSYPTEKVERDLWELEGKQPNSVKVGDKWYSLNYIQPAGTLIAAGANYQTTKDSGQDPIAAAGAAMAGASKALTEQSFLKGVSGGLEALSDPQRKAEKFMEQTAGSIVPNFIRAGARSNDDVNRVQDGPVQAVQAGIPGLRQKLPVRNDIFGQAVPRKTDGLNSYLNPLRPSNVRVTDMTGTELRRLKVANEGTTATKIQGNSLGNDAPKLSADQQRRLKDEIGPQLKTAWDKIISDPRYAKLPDAEKRQRLDAAHDDVSGAITASFGARELEYTNPKNLDKGEKAVLHDRPIDYLSKTGGVEGSSSSSAVDIHQDLGGNERKVLEDYSYMDDVQREEWLNAAPDHEYQLKKAEYENKKKRGSLSRAESATAEYELRKEEAGAAYKKEIRDLYSLNKTSLYNILTTAPDGEQLAEQILAYGDTLQDNELGDNKYRNSKGEIDFLPSAKKAAAGKKGKANSVTYSSSPGSKIANTTALSKKAASTKITARGPNVSNNIRGRSLQAYKKSNRRVVAKKA